MFSHLRTARHHVQPHGELHVVVTCFNPLRFVSRYSLLRDFVKHAADAGAIVWVAEAAFGDRPFEVTGVTHGVEKAQHVQFRIRDEIWVKEAMINATVARLPHDWRYVAWIDGDVTFLNPDWVQETIQQLQHFDVIQMWQHAIDLDPNGLPNGTQFTGFPASMLEGAPPAPTSKAQNGYYHPRTMRFHPGYAWASTRHAWQTFGGLLDVNIVGGGDHQMAHGLYGTADQAIPFESTAGNRNAVMAWQTNALALKHNVGFAPGTLVHHWHGKKARRGYFDRWQILARNAFDPVTDLKRDAYGLWQLAGNKPKLRDDLRAYFRQRQEDGLEA
jgi:hypothetical protein